MSHETPMTPALGPRIWSDDEVRRAAARHEVSFVKGTDGVTRRIVRTPSGFIIESPGDIWGMEVIT